MPTRYVPILRWMRGERVGIQKLSAAGKTNVVPLFVLAPKQYVGKKETKKAPAIPAPAVFANEMMTAWGNTPFFLDASGLAPISTSQHPIIQIASACNAIGLQMIPATKLGAPAPYQSAVSGIIGHDHRGMCLRIDLAQLAIASQWQPQLPVSPSQTDLVVDLADNVSAAAALGGVVAQAFQNLYAGPAWRSVTIAGTSMPENFQGLTAGSHLIPRIEWTLWDDVRQQTPYVLGYGDYATVPFVPPPSGIAWGFPINTRYTLAGEFLVCRGVATTGYGGVDMGPQLVGHAVKIVQHATRGPLSHIWADPIIDKIAAGVEPPQGLEHWVQLGVNRHIELVRHLLPEPVARPPLQSFANLT